MAASDQTYRNQRTLDVVFGVSCLLMLVSIVWMFAQDYYRPFKVEQVVRALEAVDSTAVTRAEWAVVQQIRSELTRQERGPSSRIDLDAATRASTHARRDPLREAGPGHATYSGSAALTLYFGPAVLVSHPYFDTRLKWDPDYLGKKDRVIAGRAAEAYVSAQWRYGELFFGSVDRNWPGIGGQVTLGSTRGRHQSAPGTTPSEH